MTSVFAQKITKIYNALTHRINDSIGSHNKSASAHSFGSNGANKSVVTDSSGNLVTEAKTVANIKDPNSATYTSIGSLNAGATQQSINYEINQKISALENELNTITSNLEAAVNRIYLNDDKNIEYETIGDIHN